MQFFKLVMNNAAKWCAYSHIYRVFTNLIRGDKLSEQGKVGRNIALLGIFCPFFWYALFSGAQKSTVILHATHSGIVFLLGVVIMVFSFLQKK